MRRLILTAITLVLFSPAPADAGRGVSVRGYYRKDGTYVRPHSRSSPDHTTANNWGRGGGGAGSYSGSSSYGSADSYSPSSASSLLSPRTTYREAARTTVEAPPKVRTPPDLVETVRAIGHLLARKETVQERTAAKMQLESITTEYEGSPEATEALRLLQHIRVEEQEERLAKLQKEKREAEAADRKSRAEAKLRLGRLFVASRNTSRATAWFEEVIKKYPETPAAGEARVALAQLRAASLAPPPKFGATGSK